MYEQADGCGTKSVNARLGGVRLLNTLERTTRALKTLSAGNRALLRASDETRLLHDMCKMAVETCGYRAAGVVYAEHNEQKQIRWMVWVGTRDGRPELMDVSALNRAGLTWDESPLGGAAVAVAIRTKAPCVGRNLLTDPIYSMPGFNTLRAQSIEGGIASVTALPLSYDGNVLGALFFSAAEPDAFDDDEVRLLADLADDLAFGIFTKRIREQHLLDQKTIERLAFCDSHTGLPNLTRLLQILSNAMESARAQKSTLAMLQLRVDRFEEVNQALGHGAAESYFTELKRRVSGLIRTDQILARISDDSFGLIVPGHTEDAAMALAHQLTHGLAKPIDVCGVIIDVPIFVGVAVFAGGSDENMDAEALVRRARAAVHQRTHTYRPIALYSGDLEEENTCRLTLMADLRRAVERNELQVYCQPKMDIRSGQVLGAEALVRWSHPLRGMVPPERFIKIAEQSGSISALTHWLLETVTDQLYAWQQAGILQSLALNLSAYDLHNANVATQIENLILTKGIRPELLQLELTESALIDDPDAALKALMRLKRLGVRILIDDFGTGYSGLSYLQKFPVDGIKIDQSFVMPMLKSQDSAIIVRATIELGHNLGLEVVAEGVEDQAVLDGLASYGCDVAQGYLLAMPMPVAEYMTWVNKWSTLPALQGRALT